MEGPNLASILKSVLHEEEFSVFIEEQPDLIDFEGDEFDEFCQERFYASRIMELEIDEDFLPFDEDKLALPDIDNDTLEQNPSCNNGRILAEICHDELLESLDREQIADMILEEMECPICLIEMVPPRQILSCSNAHLFCQNCKISALTTCPKCREDFTENPPQRSKLAERLAYKIFQA